VISNCNRFSFTVAFVTLEKEPTVLQRIEIRFQHASEKGSKSVSRSNCVANNINNTGTEGGEPNIHPAFASGQDDFLASLNTKGKLRHGDWD